MFHNQLGTSSGSERLTVKLLQLQFFSFLFISFSVIYRYGSDIRHRVVEDKLMRQKAQLLLGEAASWSLLWNLYGKG